MSEQHIALLAFNRGLVDKRGLARADIKRIGMAAEIMENWMPRVLGSMMIRPGMGYLGGPRNNLPAKYMDFVFSTSDKAQLEHTDSVMRGWVSDALITRPSVASVVTNGSFDTDLTGWTDADEAGGVSDWATGGYLRLTGTGTAAAIRYQQVTVAAADQGIDHALHIVIARGPMTLKVGSTLGGDDYVSETTIDTGEHSLAFTPTGNFYVQFESRLARLVLVDSVAIEAAGNMEVATPWPEASLSSLRWAQSGDILYVACAGYQQRQIERRATRSWSVVRYAPEDGPFRVRNVGPTTMTPSVLTGNGTLTASVGTFKSTHVGALFAVTSTGQTVTKSMTVMDDATNSIDVTGVTTDRAVTIVITGLSTTGNTVILERSFDNSTWVAVSGKSWTADTTESYTDGLDNTEVWYRLRCSVYASGTTVAKLSIATGTIRGVCRITAYTSATVVDMEVLTAFGGTTASDNWEEGKWSDRRGWPTAVGFYEGRLVWAGKDSANLSISDGYPNFDPTTEGDSGPIDRSIGSGPVDTINWVLPLQRLILGGQGAEFSCRSTSLDEPLTPSNFNIKPCSSQGSANIPALAVDTHGVYVQRGGVRVYELSLGGDVYSYDYSSTDLTAIVPKIGKPSFVRAALQRQPDTRLHFIRSDGSVAVLLFEKVENVICWLNITSSAAGGEIEDINVLPGDEGAEEDQVYYLVKRTINGATVRHWLRWALEDDCKGDQALCKIADSFVTFTNAVPTATIGGLGHLVGEQVVCWYDGKCIDDGTVAHLPKTYLVNAAGQITLDEVATTGIVGLGYTAPWQSAKLLQIQSQLGSALKSHKNIEGLGLILTDTHRYGIKFGADFDNLDDMPSMEDGAPVAADTVHVEYDQEPVVFPGTWTVDHRLCLQAQAPRPCTISAAICEVEAHG